MPEAGGEFPRAVLFDLDGTLLDSAPDMLATANEMRAARGAPPLVLAQLRPVVSKGARAMLAVAFPQWDAAERDTHVPEFLQRYEALIGRHALLFDGVETMLRCLEDAGSRWGIVTNKPEYLARLILPQLDWEARCAVLIGGDSLPERKPHPLPLQVACERMGVDVRETVYVGDDERDILAARAAGMPSVAALWGYRLAEDDPLSWQADRMIEQPAALCAASAWPASNAA
ncbi:phosphoglycolate phosphatase [Stenotrophomonas sp. HITSZ_GD]|uniref:phosphoglycolate phosphatase n=1 Tax=Stenotrophomonas sp. HITSZ_GD TaxID=3037248 RepID=UPI00240E0EAB|nr:phosphoglycolate phosphatase [Stenotrophomonas sp. HITSZ_GD]MDG2526435.1 phosphoglycolate phosphatase [Stenotrophomonas sp. HITSZ_GD]